jgi:hypothetical protein
MNFAAITLRVASQRVIIAVRVTCDPRFSVISEMADLKQRICLKFCFKLGKNTSETYEMLKIAFGDNAMGRTQTFEWFSRFKRGSNIKIMLVIFLTVRALFTRNFFLQAKR